MDLKTFIEGMPKVELHMHIEGSLEPELAFKLAGKNGVTLRKKDGTPYKDAEELKQAYKFNNLGEFLDLYYQGMSVLQTEQDFYDLTMAYLEKIKSQNVTHTEIFFDPQGHTSRGVAFDTAIEGISRALKDGEKKMGITSKLIMSFLRDAPQKAKGPEDRVKYPYDAFDTLDQADKYIKDGTIQGIGLDSYEKPYPPTLFADVYAEAKKRHPNLKLMAHAGEEGPAQFVHDSLDVLKIDRIDHGNHSLDDPKLVERLAKEGMGLTVCPLSNLKLNHTLDFTTNKKLKALKEHRLKEMLDHGLKASVNSDDPAYFGGHMNENFIAVAEALDLTRDDIVQLAKNAIETSFLSKGQKQTKMQELDAYVAQSIVDTYVNQEAGPARRFG